VHRLDHALRGAIIAHRLARELDPAAQGGWRHEAMLPDVVQQLVLRDQPVVAREQEGQHIEHLRLDVPHLLAAAQLVQPLVQLEFRELVDLADRLEGAHRTTGKGRNSGATPPAAQPPNLRTGMESKQAVTIGDPMADSATTIRRRKTWQRQQTSAGGEEAEGEAAGQEVREQSAPAAATEASGATPRSRSRIRADTR
jgi:hypothetical protein